MYHSTHRLELVGIGPGWVDGADCLVQAVEAHEHVQVEGGIGAHGSEFSVKGCEAATEFLEDDLGQLALAKLHVVH